MSSLVLNSISMGVMGVSAVTRPVTSPTVSFFSANLVHHSDLANPPSLRAHPFLRAPLSSTTSPDDRLWTKVERPNPVRAEARVLLAALVSNARRFRTIANAVIRRTLPNTESDGKTRRVAEQGVYVRTRKEIASFGEIRSAINTGQAPIAARKDAPLIKVATAKLEGVRPIKPERAFEMACGAIAASMSVFLLPVPNVLNLLAHVSCRLGRGRVIEGKGLGLAVVPDGRIGGEQIALRSILRSSFAVSDRASVTSRRRLVNLLRQTRAAMHADKALPTFSETTGALSSAERPGEHSTRVIGMDDFKAMRGYVEARRNRRGTLSGWRVPRRRSAAGLGGRDIFVSDRIVPMTPGEITKVRMVGPKGPVNVYYVRHQGGLEFAGWEEAGPVRPALPDAATRSNWIPRFLPPDALTVLGVGTGGEGALQLPLFEDRRVSIEERLALLVIEQLKRGPSSLERDRMWESFNVYLDMHRPFGIEDKLSSADWERCVQSTLRFAVRHTPAVDERGVRSLVNVHRDAARILGLTPAAFDEWENHFAQDGVAEMLFGEGVRPRLMTSGAPRHRQLLQGLEVQIGARAHALLGRSEEDFAIGRPEEMDLEWSAARISMIDSPEGRIRAAALLLASLDRMSRAAAGRLLALLAKHSELNDHPPVVNSLSNRWSREEIGALIEQLARDEAVEVVTHRCFRRFLTPEQNAFINKAVYTANYTRAVEKMNSIDVMQVSDEEFWKVVDETGAFGMFVDGLIDNALRIKTLRQ